MATAFPQTAPQANAYLRTRVMTAGPEELRQLLLEGAIRFLRQGIDGLNGKNYEQSFSGISQSRAIVMELMTSVRTDIDPDLAERVQSLYSFMYSEMVEASFDKDAARLGKVLDLLEFERETWSLAMEKLRQERNAKPTAQGAGQGGGTASSMNGASHGGAFGASGVSTERGVAGTGTGGRMAFSVQG